MSNITYTIQVNSSQAKANVNSLTAEFNKLNTSVNNVSHSIDLLINKFATLNSINHSLNSTLLVTNNTLIQITNNTNNYNTAVNNASGGISSLSTKAMGLYAALQSVGGILSSITTSGMNFEAWNAQFKAIYVTTEAVNNNFAYLYGLAEKSGQSIQVLTDNFLKFSAAAKFSGETDANIKTIFSNFTDIATVMHWSEGKTRSALTAIEQMYNKNQVMSEELKKQLGNVMPAAVNIFARSLDVTTPKLQQMMKDGAVLPKETIKNFSELAKQLLATQESLNDASHGFNAAMGRWDTAISTTSALLYEELKPAIVGTLEFATEVVKDLGMAIEALDVGFVKVNGTVVTLRESFQMLHGASKTYLTNVLIELENASNKAKDFWDNLTTPKSMAPPKSMIESLTPTSSGSIPYKDDTTLADLRAKAALDKQNKAKLEAIALANQKGLLNDKLAGDTEFTDKQIAKFIKKESDVAKQLIAEIGQQSKIELAALSSEQSRVEEKFKNHALSINEYYQKRIEFAKKELEISIKKIELEKNVIKEEAQRVQHYQDIQIANDKDVVALQKLKDKMIEYNAAVARGVSKFEGQSTSEVTLKDARDKAALSGHATAIPMVISSKEMTDLSKRIEELTKVVEDKKTNLISGLENSSNSGGTVPTATKQKLNANISDLINAASAKYGVDAAFMHMMAKVESGGNPLAHNKSGASGVYQFIPSTAKAYGMNSKTVFDAATNIDAGARFAKDNANALTKRGITVNATNLYLAHQQGVAGLADILDGGGVNSVTRRNMNSNAGSGKSAGEFYSLWDKKVSGMMGGKLPTFNNKATMAEIDTSTKNMELQSSIRAKDYEVELKNAEIQLKISELEDMRNSAIKEFERSLVSTHIEYLKMNGENTAALEFEVNNKERILTLQIEMLRATDAETKSRVQAAIEETNYFKEQLVFKEKLNALDKRYSGANDIFSLVRNSQPKSTELVTAITNSRIANDQYNTMQPIVADKISMISADRSLTSDEKFSAIAKLNVEMAKLKEETNGVANMFENKLSPIISNALDGLINGTKSAKEVMLDFGKSTLAMLQKILIEEMTAAATKGLVSVAGSAISSIIGGVAGGGLVGMASGGVAGSVMGRGTGLSDGITARIPNGSYVIRAAAANNIGHSTLARIANGEFVMPPNVAMANGGLMNYMNAMGTVPRFANGGAVGGGMAGGTVQNNSSPQFVVNVNHTGNESGSELGQKISLEMVKAIAKHEAEKSSRIATKRR